MKNMRIIAILVTLVCIGQSAYTMEMEERGKRKSPETEEKEQASKKQRRYPSDPSPKLPPLPRGIEIFFNAIQEGNLEKVNKILKIVDNTQSLDKIKNFVNYDGRHDRWPLQLAMTGIRIDPTKKPIYFQIMKNLIIRGADVNYISKDFWSSNRSLLAQAIDDEDWDKANFLLEWGAKPDEPSIALIDAKISAIKYRLEHGRTGTPIKTPAVQKKYQDQIAVMEEIKASFARKKKLKELEQERKKIELERLKERSETKIFPTPENLEYLKTFGRQ